MAYQNTSAHGVSSGLLKQAVSHVHSGNLTTAEILVKKVLDIEPDHPDANHILGIILIRKEQYKLACNAIAKAIHSNPISADYSNTLGLALEKWGHTDDALKSYERAIILNPRHFGSHRNRGNLLRLLGRFNDALSAFKMIVELFPNLPEGHNHCGVVLYEMGLYEEALSAYKSAIQLNPRYAEAHNNAGIVMQLLGHIKDAISAFDRAIQINSKYANAFYNRGNALCDMGHLEEAIRSYNRAIQENPNASLAHNNRGNTLLNLGHPAEALTAYDNAIRLDPVVAIYHNNRGNALRTLGHPADAIMAYEQAIRIDPSLAEAYNNLGTALRDLGNMEKALTAYERAINLNPAHAGAYSNQGNVLRILGRYADAEESYRRALTLDPDDAESHSNLLLSLNYRSDLTEEEIFRAHCDWDLKHAQKCSNKDTSTKFKHNEKHHRLRVGYVSADFRMHSVSYFFEPLLINHDRNEVEVYCYSNTTCPDTTTERLCNNADYWTSIVGLSDDAVADKIRRDGIDILVDLSGHTGGNRLLVFARRPAPVQVTWLGYPNTTGMQEMDYRLTDAIADPIEKAENLHTEQLVRLKDGFLSYQHPNAAPEVSNSPVFRNHYITFGSFNNLTKVSHEVVSAWSEILRATPESHLLLKNRYLADEACREQYLKLFAKHGLDTKRIHLNGRLPELKDHLALYSQVDISLDTFPYNGTTTTFEALWMGVPVISLYGDRHASRVSASILQHTGFSDWVASNTLSYIETAIRLASNKEYLAEVRRTLRTSVAQSPLCDGKGFARNIESAYRAMWKNVHNS